MLWNEDFSLDGLKTKPTSPTISSFFRKLAHRGKCFMQKSLSVAFSKRVSIPLRAPEELFLSPYKSGAHSTLPWGCVLVVVAPSSRRCVISRLALSQAAIKSGADGCRWSAAAASHLKGSFSPQHVQSKNSSNSLWNFFKSLFLKLCVAAFILFCH